jgi:HTH-type transcriptional regulator/antitoxin HigA
MEFTLNNYNRNVTDEGSLTQAAVAKLLGISPSRMSELMHGKMEPSYQLSRDLCLKLNIEPAVVLGV